MKALPTITPSAPAPIILLTCSGFETPNPTANGILPFVTGKTRLISSSVEFSIDVFAPVTPKCETRYRKPDEYANIF